MTYFDYYGRVARIMEINIKVRVLMSLLILAAPYVSTGRVCDISYIGLV